MSKFISKKEKKYNVDDIANQLISQIKNNEVDSNKINIQEIADTNINNNNSYNENNNVNNISIWDKIKSIANDLGNNVQNTVLGTKNGIKYFRQQLERSTRNNTTNNVLNMNNNFLQEQLNKNPNDEKAKILLEKNNSYQNKLKEESQNYQNKLQEKINQNNEKIQNNINNTNNTILKKTAELAPSIGQMIPGFIPGVGVIYMTGSASGQYYDDAKQRGMNDDEATIYSGIMGLMEGATELIGIGNIKKAGKGIKSLIKGTGKEALKEGTKEITKSSLKSVLKDYGIGIADNVIQEALIDPIQELTAQTVAGKDKAQWEGIGQKMLQDGINGGLVSAILGGANLGIQSCTGLVEKVKNNQQFNQQEVQMAVQDASKKLDVGQMITDSTQQQINKQTQQVTLVQNENVSNLNITTDNLKDNAINEINNSKISDKAKKEMLDVLNSMDNVTEADIKAIKQNIYEVDKTELDTNITYKDSLERKRNYIKYRDDTNTYDNSSVNEVLDIIPTNKNGNRTVKQWLQVADELGKRISDKSNSEIEQIAYKSWFDVQPTKNITKYDNVNKTNVGFQKLTSDDWINIINNAVLQQREQTIQKQNKMSQNGNIEQNLANNQEKSYNNLKIGENKKVPINDIIELQDQMGYRTDEEIQEIKEYVKKNGLDNSPIEISKQNDGTYKIEDGNHRLLIAKELGYDEVPIKLTESWENIGIQQDINETNINKDWEEIYDRNNRYNETNNATDDKSRNIKESRFGGSNEFENRKTTTENVDLSTEGLQENRQTDNNLFKGNNRELEISSSFNLPRKEDIKTKLNLPTKETINQTTQGEKIDWNEIERPEGKIRKHYRSIIESSNTTNEAKAIAKELMGTDTYVPETNKGQLAQADYRISNSSPEAELKSLMNRTIQGEKISSVDIAVGERLIQYYSKIGDKTNLQEAIQTTAMAGTSAGQTVQALAMLNHQTPEGQATWIQRSVDKMNNELAKRKGGTITKDEEGNIKVVNKKGQDITDKVDLFDLTPDMIDKIVSSKNKTEMYDNIDQVYEDLGQQVPLSTMEKIDSWRYFSMLANPKTHIRNMVGNVAMGKTQSLKDKLAGGIEDIVSTFNKDMERTKTLKQADAKTKEFAKNDVLNPDVQSMMELNENKYNPQSRLQNARKTFKNDALENTLGRLFNWNDKLLEAEDALGLKSNYKKALANYLTANKIDVDSITDKQLSKARNYAVEQAKEATFHQANSLATWINQASTNNKIAKGAKDAILPFVKTPLNVAKTGIEYNPVGLLKTITYDTVKLRKGDITVNKYIDNLSKGLTGTGIAVLGYALADAGILKASGGDDDKKEKYDEALGKQTYSITIGDRTYSLDWLAPVGIPLFVGAEAKAMKDSNKEEKSSTSSDDDKKFNQAVSSLENLANAMANSMSPMSEMSMISGLTSALKSYEQDSTKMLGTIGTNAVKSYVNQFVPTLLGQVARTTDDYERSTTSTKSGVLSKAIDQTKLQVMLKIPGLRQKLPTKEDIWGNEQKSEPNIPLRVINNFVNPSTVKNINTSKVDEELDNLYNKIGESTILPSTIEKTYTINGQTYRMTNEEYSKYKKNYGQTSYKLLDDLINSNDYNKLSDDQKQKAIENIYSYAKEANKVDYAKNNNETLKTSTLYDTLEELKQKGGNQSSYLNYIAKTKDITGEDSSKKKIEVLANSTYTDKTKEIIYKNTEGSKDKKIIVVDKLGLPINEYLKYKSQKFESDKDEDGETVKGSKNQKVYDYLNNIPDEDLSQDYKKIICKMSGINSYDKDIVNMINNNKKLTVNERTEILTNIGFKIDKQGRIQTSSVLPLVKYVK